MIKSFNNTLPGKLITLEGIDGGGKSTNVEFIRGILFENGIDSIATREPGGTPVSEKIRKVFLDSKEGEIFPDAQLMLLFASRIQNLEEVIKPALKEGKWVVCDRFTDSTYAYQGSGLKMPEIRIASLEYWINHDVQPDLTLVFDLSSETAIARLKDKNEFQHKDKYFFDRVRNCYIERSKKYTNFVDSNRTRSKRYRLIDAEKPIQEVRRKLHEELNAFIEYLSLKW